MKKEIEEIKAFLFYQVSDNAIFLSQSKIEMFENVIVDFQSRLIENQGIVINSIVTLMQEIDGIKKGINTLAEVVLLIQKVIYSNNSTKTQDGKS